MTAYEIREKFLEFFKTKGHTIIPSASLIPAETDPTALFTTAGMQPLVPYLLGENHPGGKRVASVQKCARTVDIDEVGDNRHLTFFEMLGNWSFGDYFKEEAIRWSFEFLTDTKKGLGLNPFRIYVTVFQGGGGIAEDKTSAKIWKKVFAASGIQAEVSRTGNIEDEKRIIILGKEDNFWELAGETGPCGPDTEIFYDTRPEEGESRSNFAELVASGRMIEIWNNVFMEYEKKRKDSNGEFEYIKLKQKNVDTGMGLERILAVVNNKKTVFDTELFAPLFEKIEKLSGKKYAEKKKEFRIIADHIKAGTFIIGDGVFPSNKDRGYVLRRLIRRAIRYGKVLEIEKNFIHEIAKVVIEMYEDTYKELKNNSDFILKEIEKEEYKFSKVLEEGLKKIDKRIHLSDKGKGIDKVLVEKNNNVNLSDKEISNDKIFSAEMPISGEEIFDLYQTYGFPIEMSFEELERLGVKFDKNRLCDEFNRLLKKHQELSQTAAAGKFKGGLADARNETKKLHTATHLLLATLRKVLGDHVYQKGSNITAERLRFDFSHSEKLTEKQKLQVETLVNEAIKKNLPVVSEEISLKEAKAKGAIGVFEEKYGEKVKVYQIGEGDEIFSREICGGPHVKNTGELGRFKIIKEESSGAGIRRIKAVLE